MNSFYRFWGIVLFGLLISLACHSYSSKPSLALQARFNGCLMAGSPSWVVPANLQENEGSEACSRLKQQAQWVTDTAAWVQQGQQHYQVGQFASAIAQFQQAAQAYQTSGDHLRQAQTLSWLALTYQKLGQWNQAEGVLSEGFKALQAAPAPSARIEAQLLNVQGQLQLAQSQPEAALTSWERAETLYAEAGFSEGVLGSRMNQARALQVLGRFYQAERLYAQIQQDLERETDLSLKAVGLHNLGELLRQTGDLSKAQQVLAESLAIAQAANATQQISSIWLSRGNVEWAFAQRAEALGEKDTAHQLFQTALNAYEQAIAQAVTPLLQVQAQLNSLRLLLEQDRVLAVQALIPELRAALAQLPAGREAMEAQINFAQSLMTLESRYPSGNSTGEDDAVVSILESALQQAIELSDRRAQAYALGTLGEVYEQDQDWLQATKMTQQALLQAQQIQAADLAYQWHWQMGRILRSQSPTQVQAALPYYEAAVETLKRLRSDLVVLNPEVQFSFRERIEPVYRQYVELLLSQSNLTQTTLQQARNVIEALQLAELDNFFQQACLTARPQEIDDIDRRAAVIYPIILSDRLAVILSVSGATQSEPTLYFHQTLLPQSELEAAFSEMRQSFSPVFSDQARLDIAQRLYDWLLRPFEPLLSQHAIQTLVFVPDGGLINLPMTALHDGQHYVIETYSVAVTPGLQLLPSQPSSALDAKLLVGGLTEARQGFPPLPAVLQELESIQILATSKTLLNQDFTGGALQEQVEQVVSPIVHLATHGQFSSNPENTFILTWDDRVQAKDLSSLLQADRDRTSQPIELLVLSACQTASGDRRAALGLAGLAIRSGARSTLATLWSVEDQSTAELMSEFYQRLIRQKMSRVEALRQAQLKLLHDPAYAHPYYWASFVLVGNWL